MERLSVLLLSLLCCVWIHTSSVEGTFSYAKQREWGGICVEGNTGRQSPINITTEKVVNNSNFSGLIFSPSWKDNSIKGTFANNGHTLQFTLDTDGPSVTTNTSVGNYQLTHVQFHWGKRTGSEHLIDGKQFAMEIQFMHNHMDSGNTKAGIAVLADKHDISPDGLVWSTLSVQRVEFLNGNKTLNFTLSSLLPDPGSRDYYHYPGSLTQPNCTENVQWFVLKNAIDVPAEYLASLSGMIHSTTQDKSSPNTSITSNFREPQSNSRTVSTPADITPESSAVITTSSLTAVLTVALLAIAGLN